MVDVGLTHVALTVTDLDAAIVFYEKYAGMEVVHRRSSVVWLSDRTRPFVIVLAKQAVVEHPLLPFSHLGVARASRAEVDRLAEQAKEEDCLIGGPMDSGPPVGYWAFFRDPDGNTLEVSYGQDVGSAVADDGDEEASTP